MKYIKGLLKVYIIFSSLIMLFLFFELKIFQFFNFSIARIYNNKRPVITTEDIMYFNIYNFFPLLILSTIFVIRKDSKWIGIFGVIGILLGLIAIIVNYRDE